MVAGSGPYEGNNLWDATEMNANFAYRALTYQGYTNDTIYYLSSDRNLDLNGDGIPDVDGDATNSNLQNAITQWAKDGESLVLYLIGPWRRWDIPDVRDRGPQSRRPCFMVE